MKNTKWLRRAVVTLGVAGGMFLLGAGAASAAVPGLDKLPVGQNTTVTPKVQGVDPGDIKTAPGLKTPLNGAVGQESAPAGTGLGNPGQMNPLPLHAQNVYNGVRLTDTVPPKVKKESAREDAVNPADKLVKAKGNNANVAGLPLNSMVPSSPEAATTLPTGAANDQLGNLPVQAPINAPGLTTTGLLG